MVGYPKKKQPSPDHKTVTVQTPTLKPTPGQNTDNILILISQSKLRAVLYTYSVALAGYSAHHEHSCWPAVYGQYLSGTSLNYFSTDRGTARKPAELNAIRVPATVTETSPTHRLAKLIITPPSSSYPHRLHTQNHWAARYFHQANDNPAQVCQRL